MHVLDDVHVAQGELHGKHISSSKKYPSLHLLHTISLFDFLEHSLQFDGQRSQVTWLPSLEAA